MPDRPHIACFATQGTGSPDEERIVSLLQDLAPDLIPFDRQTKRQSASSIVAALRDMRPDMVVMEGTGVAGGAAVMTAKAVWGVPFVVSSGDGIGPFWSLRHRALLVPGLAYEGSLLRMSAGFIGWTPYLVGRALTLGAPRAMTAANWPHATADERRDRIREQLDIPPTAVTFGMVGSLVWNASVGYCYGLELVRAIRQTSRPDVRVLVVGDGDGLAHLREAAAGDPRVILAGRVAREVVSTYLAAMDIGSLPQSVDGVGSFRYTTKLSEYLAAGLPVATSRVPFAYDLDEGWLWRLPGDAPWNEKYTTSLARLMEEVTPRELSQRRERVPRDLAIFDQGLQQRRATQFISELLVDAPKDRR